MERADCASVLLHDVKGNVAIIRQFWPGAIEHDNGVNVIELEVVIIEYGQSPSEADLREVQEETGVSEDMIELDYIGVYYLYPGSSNERTHLLFG